MAKGSFAIPTRCEKTCEGVRAKSRHHIKWSQTHAVSKQEREDKWHSSRSRKLCNVQRNRFPIVQHQDKSLPWKSLPIVMKKAQGLYVERKWLLSSSVVGLYLIQGSHKSRNKVVIRTANRNVKYLVFLHAAINTTDFLRSSGLNCKRPSSTDSQKHRQKIKQNVWGFAKKTNYSNSQSEKEKMFTDRGAKHCSVPMKRSVWQWLGRMSDFIFRILFLEGGERIGCLTLIHNVLRCVKLLPCQKITALHSATHALVIRGGLFWTQALSISRRDICDCVCE